MSAPDFLDSNVVIYAYDTSVAAKQRIAQALVGRAQAGDFVISTQVLAEFCSTFLHKMSPPASPKDIAAILQVLAPIKVVSPDDEIVRRAVEAHAQYGIHFYDGMIVAAAERARCNRIWSEDLNPNQKYFGIEVTNPFKATHRP